MVKDRVIGFEGFFKYAADYIRKSSNFKTSSMIFKGYDSQFMEDGCIRDAIKEFIDSEVDFWENDKLLVEAMLSEGDDIGVLEDIHNYLVKDKGVKRGVKIYTVPKEITRGFTIIPSTFVYGWDSKKRSPQPRDRENGIIYREFLKLERIPALIDRFYEDSYKASGIISPSTKTVS